MDIKNMTAENKDFLLNTYDISEDALRELAKDEEYLIRKRVAKHSNTPADVLRELAKDDAWVIRGAVLDNPNTPKDVFRYLAKDVNHIIRCIVAKNPKTDDDILRDLIKDGNWDVRYEIASNHKASSTILIILFKHEKSLKTPYYYVIQALYRNKNLPYIAKIIIETLYREILPPNTIK